MQTSEARREGVGEQMSRRESYQLSSAAGSTYVNDTTPCFKQEAQLWPRDRAMRRVS